MLLATCSLFLIPLLHAGTAGRETRPLRRKTSRSCHFERSEKSASPVPIFNVFKSQFENSDIFNFQLSIRPGRAACGEQCSPLRAGCCEWGEAHGRQIAGATDGCGRGYGGRLRAVPTGGACEVRRDGEPVPYGGKRSEYVIARPVRRLVVAIRNSRPHFQCFQIAI